MIFRTEKSAAKIVTSTEPRTDMPASAESHVLVWISVTTWPEAVMAADARASPMRNVAAAMFFENCLKLLIWRPRKMPGDN